ncbi:MAG: IscS subfamily cysteine desulfurase [Phycisphaerae bacterium]|jgi:cysteine desulfurase|nr:IscS subfamily cysteine desulfurase [Phycisphaerae bacterium]
MALSLPIYMDHNATTPIDPRVLEVMMPYLTEHFGNAASRNHSFGWKADAAVDKARQQVANLIGALPKDIVFTSGATESNNLAIKGAAQMCRRKGNHIVTSLMEHKAVIDPCRRLEEADCQVTWLKGDGYGRVSPKEVDRAVTDKTILISIMAANNEVGTLNPIAQIGKVARRRGVLFHTDATQAAGRIPIDIDAMCIDLLSLSAHKICGPKGVGCLYVRRRGPPVHLTCQIDGGGHERGMRSGTLNVPGVVGLGAAAEIVGCEMTDQAGRLTALRDRLTRGIMDGLDFVTLNGHPAHRLPNTANLSFAYVEGEALMMKIKDIAVSSGSACTSTSLEPGHVLRAMGVSDAMAQSSIRFSLGRTTTSQEVDYVIDQVIKAVGELRELSPLYELAMEQARE